jgi:hypothetical protein
MGTTSRLSSIGAVVKYGNVFDNSLVTPGPGYYSPYNDSLVKKSFNSKARKIKFS